MVPFSCTELTRRFSTTARWLAKLPGNSYWNPDYHKKDYPEIPAADTNQFGEAYRKLQLFPNKKIKFDPWMADVDSLRILPPRWTRMKPSQDWTSVWPTAHSFKGSVVPLPIRMGFVKDKHLKIRQPQGKHANLELMKIPNFLHLTPVAIEKHCRALQAFCTEWPQGLQNDQDRQKHFPLEISTCDYVMAGPSVRDPRSRIVTLRVPLENLKLDDHARWKFIKLVGSRYNKTTDTVTIVTDRCPARHQNRDYAMYLLTALVHQSRKIEAWESELDEEDRVKYSWEGTKSKHSTLAYIKAISKANTCKKEAKSQAYLPHYISHELMNGNDLTDEYLNQCDLIQSHAKVMEKYFEDGEDEQIVTKYSASVRQLLGIPELS